LPKKEASDGKRQEATASSGNVFADLGLANPEEELLKAKLVRENTGDIALIDRVYVSPDHLPKVLKI
jgi:hypothetical protein